MKKGTAVLGISICICLLGWVLWSGCDGDDDDEVIPTPTPSEVTPTPTPVQEVGVLNIWTTPVTGDIYLDGEWQGLGAWQGTLPVGTYTVSFGDVAGYATPEDIEAHVRSGDTADVVGEYYITFFKTFGGEKIDSSHSVEQTSDGGYILTGTTSSFGARSSDVILLKTGGFGVEQWLRLFGGEEKDLGAELSQTSDAGYIIIGTAVPFVGIHAPDAYLIKTDTGGNILWSRTYGSPYYDDYGSSVQQTNDGGYIILYNSFLNPNGFNFLVKVDADGYVLWSRTFGEDCVYCYSVRQTSDGGFVIVGQTNFSDTAEGGVYLLKTDECGYELWSRTFGGEGSEYGCSVQQTDDGGFVIVGYSNSFGVGIFDVYLIKTDEFGHELWSRTLGRAESQDYGTSVRQTTDGGYIIAGSTLQVTCDLYLIKTDEQGNEIWSKTMNTDSDYKLYAVRQTEDGGYIIVGSTGPYNNNNIVLIKTDPQGNI